MKYYNNIPPHDASNLLLEAWQQNEYALLAAKQEVRGLVHFIAHHSRYLLRLLELHPDALLALLNGGAISYCEAINGALLAEQVIEQPIPKARRRLRIAKQQCSLMVALADITGLWTLEQVTAALSDFADAAVRFALEQLYRHAVPKSLIRDGAILTQQAGIAILGMGKLGGRELNYSSDIDLIVIYDPEKLEFLAPPARNRWCVRLIQQLTSFLQDREEEGYVFRVDLRLRPDPASNGLAVAYDTALRYYEQVGQNWERAAMIKARLVAGDSAIGAAFQKEMRSFIWRNHLDFAAIEDILSIKRQMQAAEEPDIMLPNHHIKTGYGGIREIEFLAQIHQLIWGGRIPELRIKPTCEVLHLLVKYDLIEAKTNDILQQAYRLYRLIEHRLQMRMDQQTHRLPDSEAGLAQLAEFCGMEAEIFKDTLLHTLNQVHSIFIHTFEESTPLGVDGKLVFTGVDHDSDTIETLQYMGYADPEAVSFAIQQWHKGHKRCIRTKRAREILTELVPSILVELSKTVDPDQAFKRFDTFLDSLPVGVQPFSLFAKNRELLKVIADITGNAPILARLLSSYPQLLDVLVRSPAFALNFSETELEQELQSWLFHARNDEEWVDNFILFKIEQEFMIGVALLERHISAATASTYLTKLADIMIHTAIWHVMYQLNEKYNVTPDVHFAFIALGKLGTGELMIGSDLDVMCVYDIPAEIEDGSEQMMQLMQYYNRLTTRLIHLLSHPTKQGALYEMDTKLRPYGAQGAVAVKLNAFREYYAASAWLVENLALLQARVVYVSEPIRQGLYDALWQAQQIPESATEIAENIHEVRRKISEQHFSSNPWDIKYVWGGLMDMQWVLKALIAHHSVQHHLPAYGMSTNEHIDWLYDLAAIDVSQRDSLHEAHELFHTVLNYLRLCHGDTLKEERITEGLKQLLVQVTGTRSFKKLQQKLLRLQGQVYHLYQNLAYV